MTQAGFITNIKHAEFRRICCKRQGGNTYPDEPLGLQSWNSSSLSSNRGRGGFTRSWPALLSHNFHPCLALKDMNQSFLFPFLQSYWVLHPHRWEHRHFGLIFSQWRTLTWKTQGMFPRNWENKQVWCKNYFYAAHFFAALCWGHLLFQTPVHLKTLTMIPYASFTNKL